MLKTIKDIIHYLYKFKSPFLIISNSKSILGFVRTRDVTSLMNIGIENPHSIIEEIKIQPIQDILKEEINNSNTFPVYITHDNSIDLISINELNYFIQGDINLPINFEVILKNLPIPIIITDRFNKILWINFACLEHIKLDETDLLGKNIEPLIDFEKMEFSVAGKTLNISKSQIIAIDIKLNVYIIKT
ncbi:MAG: hypothetical protein N2712_07465 [Brevinematales bacterium]|nr:hypothetical protein [Brevinematales bacterium]